MGWVKDHDEEVSSRGFDDTDDAICSTHIADQYLCELVEGDTATGECVYCSRRGDDLIRFTAIAQHVVDAIERSYSRAEVTAPWVPTVETNEVLWSEFEGVFDTPAQLMALSILEEIIRVGEWEPIRWEIDDESTYAAWRKFRELVTHESRFIFIAQKDSHTPDGAEVAARFVSDFQQILVNNERSLIRELPVGTVIYRGRMVESPDRAKKLANAADLGAAPAGLAAANRMSPAGISFFYASADHDTAVAEIAAHDAQQRDFALVGAFHTLRPLRILDLSRLELPSIFDVENSGHRSDLGFLKGFTSDITAPIKLDGREHRDYAPTQVLTELIRWSQTPSVHGIALPSAQSPTQATTYVFFFGPNSAVSPESQRRAIRPTFSLTSRDVAIYRVGRRVIATRMPWRIPDLHGVHETPGGPQ